MENFIFSRHAERADGPMGLSPEADSDISEKYPSITKKGEQEAREAANNDFAEMIDGMGEGEILFIGGSSDERRTKDTPAVIGDELKKRYERDDKVAVFSRDDFASWQEEDEGVEGKVLNKVKKAIADNSGKKIVFVHPLYVKELSLRPYTRDKETGQHTPYAQEILERAGFDEKASAKEWFKSNGKITTEDGVLEMPTPQEMAELQIQGIERLRDFAKKIAGERKVNIGVVGHGWYLDALAVYLANHGKVNSEFYEKEFGAEPIRQTEVGRLSVADSKAVFKYRNKEYNYQQ